MSDTKNFKSIFNNIMMQPSSDHGGPHTQQQRPSKFKTYQRKISKFLPHTYLQPIEQGFRNIGFQFNRTDACKHQGSCALSALLGSAETALLCYLVKASTSTIFGFKKLISSKKFLRNFTSKDSLGFGLSVLVFLLVFRALICSSRRKLNARYEKIMFFVGGLLGGTLASLLLSKKSRQAFALFLMARAFYFTYLSLVHKKVISHFKLFYPLVLCFTTMITGGHGFITEPISIPKDLLIFYRAFAPETAAEEQMRIIWIARNNQKLLKRGAPEYDPLDFLPHARKQMRKQV